MEKSDLVLIVVLTATLFFISCTSAERSTEPSTKPAEVYSNETININTASKDELRRIPFIGERLADDIIKYRETHGPFRRPEHLMLLSGISDGRFREIRHLIRVD